MNLGRKFYCVQVILLEDWALYWARRQEDLNSVRTSVFGRWCGAVSAWEMWSHTHFPGDSCLALISSLTSHCASDVACPIQAQVYCVPSLVQTASSYADWDQGFNEDLRSWPCSMSCAPLEEDWERYSYSAVKMMCSAWLTWQSWSWHTSCWTDLVKMAC